MQGADALGGLDHQLVGRAAILERQRPLLDEVHDRHAVVGVGVADPRGQQSGRGDAHAGIGSVRVAKAVARLVQPQQVGDAADPDAEHARPREPAAERDDGVRFGDAEGCGQATGDGGAHRRGKVERHGASSDWEAAFTRI